MADISITPSVRRISLLVIPVEEGTNRILHDERQNIKISVHSVDGVGEMFDTAFTQDNKLRKFYDAGDQSYTSMETLDTNEASFVSWPALVKSMTVFIETGKERIILEACEYDGAGKAASTVFFIKPNVQQQPAQPKKKSGKHASKVTSGGSDNGPSSEPCGRL